MDKYVHKGDGAIVHCPNCRGVIIKSLEPSQEGSGISFVMYCQHCKKLLLIKIILKSGEKVPEILVENYKF
ncbi:MAG: hypothetical protein HYY86_00495 [Candidatus Harrisonbacteria bacterium]|nr:hypothetical protein [Candidatus Harrisonbacteria bacterium]